MDNDLSKAHQEKAQSRQLADDMAFVDSIIGEDTTETPEPTGEDSVIAATAKDVGRGVVEMPVQTAGVFSDMINDVSELAYDVGNWANENLADLGQITWGDDGVSWQSGVPDENLLKVPTTPKAVSKTGQVYREMMNFVGLYVGAGKFRGLAEGLKLGAKTNPTVSKAMLQGFVADYVNKPEDNLSKLIQSYPDLENPVTEWLACDEDCSEMDKRLRTAIEGLGIGAATEAGFFGMRKALGALKASRKVKDEIIKEGVVPEQDLAPEVVKELTSTSALGDARKPLFKAPPKTTVKGKAKEDADVFINWARIDSDEDVKELIQGMADLSKESIKKGQRGVRTWEQTKLAAKDKDAWKILQDLNKQGPGATLNAEESFAIRELWTASGKKLKEVAQLASAKNDAATQTQFQKMLAIHNTIQEKAIGARTEAARTLNSWKIPSGGDLSKLVDFNDMIANGGGADVSQAMAKRLTTLMDNPAAFDAYARGSTWAKTKEAATQLWYFSLLSGPHTHVRNFISNIGAGIFTFAERGIGAATGKHIAMSEPLYQLHGMVEGFKSAFKVTSKGRETLLNAATKAAKGDVSNAGQMIKENADEFGSVYRTAATGRTGFGVDGKLDLGHAGKITPLAHQLVENFAGTKLGKLMGGAVDYMDTAIHYPAKAADAVTMTTSRALQTTDEMFKTIGFNAELHAQAARKANEELATGAITKEGLRGRIAELISDPDEFMKIAAKQQAEYQTFMKRPDPSSDIWKVLRATGRLPAVGKIIMPFTRIVYNLGEYTFERTPLAPLVKRWSDDVAAGGARAELAYAKAGLGTMFLGAAADMSLRGYITGSGDPSFAKAQLERRQGIQPNSLKIGDNYFSYRGVEPLSSPLNIASNIVQITSAMDEESTEVDELMIAAALSIGDQLISQQYMTGVSTLFDAMSDPTRKGEKWLQSTVGAMVPAAVKTYTKTQDPYIHQVENLTDTILSKLPHTSDGVPYKIDLWGRKITVRSNMGELYDTFSPFRADTFEPEPIDIELESIEYFPKGMGKKQSFDGVTIDMEQHPKAWQRLKELAGNEATKNAWGAPIDPITNKGAKDSLNLIVQNKHPGYPMYQYLTPGPNGAKKRLIQNVMDLYRDAARSIILKEFPEIKAEVDASKNQSKYVFQ